MWNVLPELLVDFVALLLGCQFIVPENLLNVNKLQVQRLLVVFGRLVVLLLLQEQIALELEQSTEQFDQSYLHSEQGLAVVETKLNCSQRLYCFLQQHKRLLKLVLVLQQESHRQNRVHYQVKAVQHEVIFVRQPYISCSASSSACVSPRIAETRGGSSKKKLPAEGRAFYFW